MTENLSTSRYTSISRQKANLLTTTLCGEENTQAYRQALEQARHWRAQHAEPTRECFSELRRINRYKQSPTVFRLKRMDSILQKLKRGESHFTLGALDDIGGCRCIARNMNNVRKITEEVTHSFEVKRCKDYIECPQASGYRSCHVIAKIPSGQKNYRVEIQIRTKLQHLWATSLEAEAMMHDPALKTGLPLERYDLENQYIARFFSLMSSYFCLIEETPQHVDYQLCEKQIAYSLKQIPTIDTILDELRVFSEENITPFIVDYPADTTKPGGYFLLDFNIEEQTIQATHFDPSAIKDAMDRYNESEIESQHNVVLVSAKSVNEISGAFPNYFGGTSEFVEYVEKLI
ncbi:MAG: RelA/SpoT domain-containing protein [Bifidobacterium psychraerophilum]|jgi:ppGpp synthetase/RelA/SpoT-type nucleotidyltranferase|uniref:hypothetical protein n=1 Tax=Bifidobacterium psychraerophilum TaxID=218140 RepID=UPI0039E85A52